ncbi:hypothetical protein SAMN06273570_3235 [Candidatus Pantoea floridensis]|uniref:Fumarase D n=1 Tax=Candidatus Pantoea floridensis TaxID=1938870 RepID=A0A286BXD0_9GAMM|nr:hypothetical protein BX596_0682 [Enterobacteriaceae bacterium JKS000233]SOD38802.1 hypothetical protein SAMN06273570_3235 [Pantoea floridensis]
MLHSLSHPGLDYVKREVNVSILSKQLEQNFDDACQIVGQVAIQKAARGEETSRSLLVEEISRLATRYKALTGEEHLAMRMAIESLEHPP